MKHVLSTSVRFALLSLAASCFLGACAKVTRSTPDTTAVVTANGGGNSSNSGGTSAAPFSGKFQFTRVICSAAPPYNLGTASKSASVAESISNGNSVQVVFSATQETLNVVNNDGSCSYSMPMTISYNSTSSLVQTWGQATCDPAGCASLCQSNTVGVIGSAVFVYDAKSGHLYTATPPPSDDSACLGPAYQDFARVN